MCIFLTYMSKLLMTEKNRLIYLSNYQISHQSMINDTQFEYFRPLFPTMDNISIVNCYFRNMSITKSGGVLKLAKPTLSSILNKVCFINCMSTAFGGAIYYQGSILALDCTYFDTCTSIEGGQAIFTYLDKTNSFFRIESSTVIKSSDRTFIGLCQSIFIDNGFQNISLFNSSFNIVEAEAAAIHSTRNFGQIIKHSSFVNNTGDTIFWLHKLSQSSTMQYLNIIRNSAPHKGSIFFFEDSITTIRNSALIKNQGYLFDGGNSLTLHEVYADDINFLLTNSILLFSKSIITNSETFPVIFHSYCNNQYISESSEPNLISFVQLISDKQIKSKTYFAMEEMDNLISNYHLKSFCVFLCFTFFVICMLAYLLHTRLQIRRPIAFRTFSI